MARRQSKDPLERYDTPDWMTVALLHHVPMLKSRAVFEPCAGKGAISDVLVTHGDCQVVSKDIEPRSHLVFQGDTLASLDGWPSEPIGVVTNTPFSRGADLVRLGMTRQVPFIVNLSRLTFLEGVPDRADIPDPDFMLVLPRIQPWFTGRKADAVTVAWMCWWSDASGSSGWPRGIKRLSKPECRGYLNYLKVAKA